MADYIIYDGRGRGVSHSIPMFMPRGIFINADDSNTDATYAQIKFKTWGSGGDGPWVTLVLATHIVHPFEVARISMRANDTTARGIRIFGD